MTRSPDRHRREHKKASNAPLVQAALFRACRIHTTHNISQHTHTHYAHTFKSFLQHSLVGHTIILDGTVGGPPHCACTGDKWAQHNTTINSTPRSRSTLPAALPAPAAAAAATTTVVPVHAGVGTVTAVHMSNWGRKQGEGGQGPGIFVFRTEGHAQKNPPANGGGFPHFEPLGMILKFREFI